MSDGQKLVIIKLIWLKIAEICNFLAFTSENGID